MAGEWAEGYPIDLEHWQRMVGTRGSTIALEAYRSAEVQERDGMDRTISPEAARGLLSSVGGWMLSRIGRYQAETGKAAQRVKLEVKVLLDGEEVEVGILDLTGPLDGAHRRRAVARTGRPR